MNYAAVETAARHAWPAIEEQQMPYGILRFARGYTRRANSLTLFGASAVDFNDLLADCEAFFASRSQPASIRVPGLPVMSGLDRFLEINGYASEAPSRVMVRQLDTRRSTSLQARRLDRDSWLDKYSAISELAATEQCNHQQLVNRIEHDVFYAVLENDCGMPACCALAIHCKGVIGIYNVATAASCRRQQFASHLITVLLDWGSEIGARHAYLQVEDANLPAIKLYSKLGFRKFYQYRYRVKRAAGECSWRDSK